jgi:hypothetical protein
MTGRDKDDRDDQGHGTVTMRPMERDMMMTNTTPPTTTTRIPTPRPMDDGPVSCCCERLLAGWTMGTMDNNGDNSEPEGRRANCIRDVH